MIDAEEDIARTLVTRWAANATLDDVPLWRGRIPARQRPATPYASFTVRPGLAATYNAPAGSGAKYIDYRVVEVKLWCARASASTLAQAMNAVICNGERWSTTGACLRAIPTKLAETTQDPTTRAGEDVWLVTCTVDIATERTL